MLVRKLLEDDIATKSHFKKMKVNRAKHLLSRDISAALEFLADENTASEYFATAFFIKTVARWFCFMTSRHPTLALNKHNNQKFEETIAFLRQVIELF